VFIVDCTLCRAEIERVREERDELKLKKNSQHSQIKSSSTANLLVE
jgi:hypothetical protein